MPSARKFHGLAATGGILYLFGGLNFETGKPEVLPSINFKLESISIYWFWP